MHKATFLSIILCALLHLDSAACSCADTGDFCSSIRQSEVKEDFSVFSCRVIRMYVYSDPDHFDLPMMDVVMADHLAGPVSIKDTISLFGQDGVNCAASLHTISEGDDLIVSIHDLNKRTSLTLDSLPYHLKELSGCGTYFMRVVDDLLLQYRISEPTIDTMEINDFMDQFESCTGLKLMTTGSVRKEIRKVVVYPNPTDGRLSIQAQFSHQKIHVRLYHMTGQVIMDTTGHGPDEPIDLQGLPKGTYLLTIEIGSQRYQEKIVVY